MGKSQIGILIALLNLDMVWAILEVVCDGAFSILSPVKSKVKYNTKQQTQSLVQF